jgi:hypothetical protein
LWSSRELGLANTPTSRLDFVVKSYVTGLEREKREFELWSGRAISAFDVDPIQKGIFIGHSYPGPAGAVGIYNYSSNMVVNDRIFRGPISSLHCNPSRGVMVATTTGYGTVAAEVYIGRVYQIRLEDATVTSSYRIPCSHAIWDAMPSYGTETGSGEPQYIGLATKKGAQVWKSHCASELVSIGPPGKSRVTRTLDWLNGNTLAFASIQGTVLLYDVRSTGSSTICKHGSSIYKLRRAGSENQFLVAGRGDSMVLYDTRMLSATVNSRSGKPLTGSLVRFSEYENQDDIELGMEINSRLGIVAVGMQGGRLGVFSTANGKLLKSWTLDDDVPALRWVEHELWAASGATIQKFRW